MSFFARSLGRKPRATCTSTGLPLRLRGALAGLRKQRESSRPLRLRAIPAGQRWNVGFILAAPAAVRTRLVKVCMGQSPHPCHPSKSLFPTPPDPHTGASTISTVGARVLFPLPKTCTNQQPTVSFACLIPFPNALVTCCEISMDVFPVQVC